VDIAELEKAIYKTTLEVKRLEADEESYLIM